MTMQVLPYGRQCIDDEDIDAVVEALKSDFLTTGPRVPAFEKALSAATGAPEAVACSNATTALHMTALVLGLGPGDCAIVPSVTFLATANAIRYTGADVVFADVNPGTGLMEESHLQEALSRAPKGKVKAVYPVHLAGQAVDTKKLRPIAEREGLAVVADSCHAIGGTLHGAPVGSCEQEDMCVFSFHSVKTVAMGEGGAITTRNSEWAEKMRSMRSHGMIKKPEVGPWYYEMPEIGFNYRVTDIQCALGITQLKKLSRFVGRRRQIVEMYNRAFSSLGNVISCPEQVPHGEAAWHLYQLRIDFAALGRDRAAVMKYLMDEGVGTQVHYIPVHTQPYYRSLYGELDLPGANAFYEGTLSLPLYPGMTDQEVDHVCNAVRKLAA